MLKLYKFTFVAILNILNNFLIAGGSDCSNFTSLLSGMKK